MPGRILPAFGDERVLPTSPGSLSTGRFPINAHRSELFGPGLIQLGRGLTARLDLVVFAAAYKFLNVESLLVL